MESQATDEQTTEAAGKPEEKNPYEEVQRLRKVSRLQIEPCAKQLGIAPALWSSLEKNGVPSPEKMIEAIRGAAEAERARIAEALKG